MMLRCYVPLTLLYVGLFNDGQTFVALILFRFNLHNSATWLFSIAAGTVPSCPQSFVEIEPLCVR